MYICGCKKRGVIFYDYKEILFFDLENRKHKGNIISENVPIRMQITYSEKRIELSTS